MQAGFVSLPEDVTKNKSTIDTLVDIFVRVRVRPEDSTPHPQDLLKHYQSQWTDFSLDAVLVARPYTQRQRGAIHQFKYRQSGIRHKPFIDDLEILIGLL